MEQANLFNPERLSFALRRRGMTKRALSIEIGVTPQSVYNYCDGRRFPDEEIVGRFSVALTFPTAFFYKEDMNLTARRDVSFRALKRTTARRLDQARAVGDIGVMLADWLMAKYRLPAVSLPPFPLHGAEPAAMAMREFWRLGELSIRNMVGLLEQHGVRVFALSDDLQEVDAFSFWSGDIPYVLLNTHKSSERVRMDAAHELGHLVLHHGGHGDSFNRQDEREATEFASIFLMPTGSVLRESGRGNLLGIEHLIRLKSQWKTSLTSLIVRLHRLGVLSKHHYTSLMIEATTRGFKIDEPNSCASDRSLILEKAFAGDRHRNVADAAKSLAVYPAEVYGLLMGLAPTPVPLGMVEKTASDASEEAGSRKDFPPPKLVKSIREARGSLRRCQAI